MLVLCPYCCSSLDDQVEQRRLAVWRRERSVAVPCPTCGGDVTRDAPIESTPEAYRVESVAQTCGSCGASMHCFAVRCPKCRSSRS